MARADQPYRGGHGADRHHAQLPVAAISAANAGCRAAISGFPHAAAQRSGVPAGVGAVARTAGVVCRVADAVRFAVDAGRDAVLCARACRHGGTDRPAACAARGAAGCVPPRRGGAAGRPAGRGGHLAVADRAAGVFAARAELAGGHTDAHRVRADHPVARARGRLAGRRGLLHDGCACAREQRRDEVGLSSRVLCARAADKHSGEPPAVGRAAASCAGRGRNAAGAGGARHAGGGAGRPVGRTRPRARGGVSRHIQPGYAVFRQRRPSQSDSLRRHQ